MKVRSIKQQVKQKKKAFTKFLSVFEKEVSLQAFNCNKEIAKAIAEDAKEAIDQQTYNWAPLSKRYLEYKIQRGFDPRIYIKTRELYNSISWGVTHGKIWTGIPSRKIHPWTGKRRIPISQIARWLEFGTSKMPPRPIWRPLLAKYMLKKPEFAKRYRKAVSQAVARAKKDMK
jgi:hypothetical protein